MKSLHKIKPNYGLTDKELSIIYYIQTGREPGWKLAIGPNGRLWSNRTNRHYGWEEMSWGYLTEQIWEEAGKPVPDFSILVPFK